MTEKHDTSRQRNFAEVSEEIESVEEDICNLTESGQSNASFDKEIILKRKGEV
jgi:hypothetical protein